jgi:hypothetical protein
MSCFKLIDGVLRSVAEPVEFKDGEDFDESIRRAGYVEQISTEVGQISTSEVRLFVNSESGAYLLDIWGSTQQMAFVVADNFPHLVQTLQALGPLVSLIGLEQHAQLQIEAMTAAKGEERHR